MPPPGTEQRDHDKDDEGGKGLERKSCDDVGGSCHVTVKGNRRSRAARDRVVPPRQVGDGVGLHGYEIGSEKEQQRKSRCPQYSQHPAKNQTPAQLGTDSVGRLPIRSVFHRAGFAAAVYSGMTYSLT